MFYPDLTCYRDADPDDPMANVYPQIKNVGWLWRDEPYPKGKVDPRVLQKLKDLLFLDVKYTEARKEGTFDPEKAILVHTMHMRGSPLPCPFCEQVIGLEPDGVQVYSGDNEMVLGRNEMLIPSLKKPDEFYSVPTLIYHYIAVHEYLPPQEFINAVLAFDLTKPIDVEEFDPDCVEIPVENVTTYQP